MGTLANAFALLGDQQGKEGSIIVALKTAEIKKIAEKKKKIAENNKKISQNNKKAKAKKNKKQKESFDGQRSLDNIVVNQGYNDHPRKGHSDGEGNTRDGQATQEHKTVKDHGNKNQAKVSVKSVVGTKEELRERLLARENERKKEEAERKERWLAREVERKERQERWLAREAERKQRQEQLLAREVERNERLVSREAESKERRLAREEERKKEMARKTLKEYVEQKAYEKEKAKKVSLGVPETPLREGTLDNIYTKQKSKDETVKKDSNTKNCWKVRKAMNIEEFLKLPTETEGQHGQYGMMGEDSGKNTNGNSTGYSRTRATDKQEYALLDEENTVKVKARPAPDLSEANFPVLGKVTEPLNSF